MLQLPLDAQYACIPTLEEKLDVGLKTHGKRAYMCVVSNLSILFRYVKIQEDYNSGVLINAVFAAFHE